MNLRLASGFSWLRSGLALAALGFAVRAVADETLLLVDDYEVLYRSGTKRILHPAERRPEAVIVQDRPWERTISYNSVHRDPVTGKYRLWYQSLLSADPESSGVAYAESDDGIVWRKPDLGIYRFDGRDTNFVLAPEAGHYGASVMIDSRETDPARRYKLVCFRAREENGRKVMGLAVGFSPDGLHWRMHPTFPLIKGSYGQRTEVPLQGDTTYAWGVPRSVSDVINVLFDEPRGLYVIYAKTWLDMPDGRTIWKRAIVRTESRDFLNWSVPELVIQPDEFDGTGVEYFPPAPGKNPTRRGIQLHGGPVFRHAGVYFSLLQKMDGEITGRMPSELAISRDGITWSRPFRSPDFIGLSPDPNHFDAGCLWTNETPVILDDEIRFYYGAYSGLWNGDLLRTPSGIGLAVLPLDRFAGVSPINGIGQITLRPRSLADCQGVTENAAIQGELRVEVLDAQGYRLPGFTREDAVPLHGDSLRHAVAWKTKTLRDLPPGRYSLRLHLDRAEVFALTLH